MSMKKKEVFFINIGINKNEIDYFSDFIFDYGIVNDIKRLISKFNVKILYKKLIKLMNI